MARDLVSIIIPTYNRAYCIRKTLDSVIAQTHANWEALVIDDGSTDDTREVINSTYAHEPRIRYLDQRNSGVSNARNTGIRHATGDYIAFLDSDDTWQDWKLALQLNCLRRFPDLGMVWTDMQAVDVNGDVIDPAHLRTMYSAYRSFTMAELFDTSLPLSELTPTAPQGRFFMGDIYPKMILGSLVHTSTVMLRRERLEQVKTFDEQLRSSGEDYDFHLRTCKYGRVGLIDVASVRYQKGRLDHLSNDSYATSRNFLATVQYAIAGDAETDRFPPNLVRQALIEAHGWFAQECFRKADRGATRAHALQSLRRRPHQLRLALLFCISCTPQGLSKVALRACRSLKRVTSMARNPRSIRRERILGLNSR